MGTITGETWGQERAAGLYSNKETFGVFALYSNDSSHILIGTTENRKLAGLGLSYTRRLAGGRAFEWDWEPEVRPLDLIREPWSEGTVTVDQAVGYYPGGVGPFKGQTQRDCLSGSRTVTVVVNEQQGDFYTETINQTCYSTWTYAGGFSPLGQRVSSAKGHRLQPFLVANGGLLVTPHDVPSINSNRLNFTFEVGGGFEWFRDHRHSFTLDYRLHHLSNAYTGFQNPGIDSQVYRVSYRLGR